MSGGPSGRGGRSGGEFRPLAVYSSVIFLLPATLFGGYLAGSWLDDWLGTGPWLTISGVMLGGAAGFVELFRLLRRAP